MSLADIWCMLFGPKQLKEITGFLPTWKIWRHRNDDDFGFAREQGNLDLLAFDISVIEGNLLLNTGASIIWDAIIAGGITLYNNATAQIGVGDSSTPEADTQTGLQGTAAYKDMDTSYPLKSGTGDDTVEFQSVFGSAEGNQAWNEFTVRNGATANVSLNRKVSAQGNKASGQTWTIKISIQGT